MKKKRKKKLTKIAKKALKSSIPLQNGKTFNKQMDALTNCFLYIAVRYRLIFMCLERNIETGHVLNIYIMLYPCTDLRYFS